MNIEIPSQVEKILKLLELSGYEAYIVGGCVRDSILGITPNDWDITTVAIPSQIIDVFKNYRTIKTGIKHGTVSVVMDKMCVEITTYRTETAYSDNRHPDVVNYVSCINDDLKRRDFTINSMAYNPQSGLLDIFNGFSDIQNKIIRCVGNPDERFKEDSLRILRCIRFSACYNFNIEKNTKKSIHDNAKSVTNISVERIISEFNKFIICDSVSELLNEYVDVFVCIIPEIIDMVGFEQLTPYHNLDVWKHTLKAIKNIDGKRELRLAVLLHDIGKPKAFTVDKRGIGHFNNHAKISAEMTRKILKRLHYDNNTIDNVELLVKYHNDNINNNKKEIKHWLNKIDIELFKKLVYVKIADTKAKEPKFQEINLEKYYNVLKTLNEIVMRDECFSIKKLAINGDDLISLGLIPGKQIGKTLERLIDDVIEENVKNTKEELIAYVENQINNDIKI